MAGPSSRSDVVRATVVGLACATVVVVSIWVGSRRFRDFDTALVSYAGAAVLSAARNFAGTA